MAILEVKNLEKHFGATQVLRDISFELEEGQALAIIGSSGSGKSGCTSAWCFSPSICFPSIQR